MSMSTLSTTIRRERSVSCVTSQGQTKADYLTTETFNGVTYRTAYALFTPFDKQAQYAICSPITDSDGTLYFKTIPAI